MVEHFLLLRRMDKAYAARALLTYERAEHCPQPGIRQDIEAAHEAAKKEFQLTGAPHDAKTDG